MRMVVSKVVMVVNKVVMVVNKVVMVVIKVNSRMRMLGNCNGAQALILLGIRFLTLSMKDRGVCGQQTRVR